MGIGVSWELGGVWCVDCWVYNCGQSGIVLVFAHFWGICVWSCAPLSFSKVQCKSIDDWTDGAQTELDMFQTCDLLDNIVVGQQVS